jgi:hypothetical protein
MGFAPLTRGRLEFDQLNTTPASSWIAGGGLFFRQPTSEHTAIELGSGAILAVVETNGESSVGSNLMGVSDFAISWAGYARVGAELALARNLALRLDLLGGVVFQRAVFQRIPRDPTSQKLPAWDRTFAAALGGVEARWF